MKATVEGLDGVKTLSFENNTLVIETGKGTKVEVPVPEATQMVDIELKDNILYVNGEEAGKVEVAGGSSQVVSVKGGELYIDGVKQDLQLGDAVAVVPNYNAGTYTLSVNGTEYELPMAVAEVGISILDNKYDADGKSNYKIQNNSGLFTEFTCDASSYRWIQTEAGGINWAVATADNADWGITKGDLLVGQINTIDIAVLPVSYDLSNKKLELRDSNGNKAKVTVSVVGNDEEGPLSTGSRAASARGEYRLAIQMDETVTADNIETAFATNINNSPENIKYALYVDDMRATDYDFIIDTDENALAQRALTFDVKKLFFDGVPAAVTISNTTTIGVEYEFNKPIEILYGDGSVYDYKVELTTGDEDEAEARGVEIGADGKSIVVKPTASGKTPSGVEFGLWVNMIDVNGNTVDKEEVYIKFGKMEMANIRLSTVPYKVVTSEDANAKNLIIELVKDGEYIFENLTADQVDNNLKGNWKLTVSDGDKFLVSSTNWATTAANIKYYATLDAAQKFGNDDIDLLDPSDKRKARQIKYAVIPVSSYNNSAVPTDGDPYELKLTLTTGSNAKEIKEITVPVDVQLPTWDEIFNQNNTASMWENGAFKSRIIADFTSGNKAKIALNGAYIHNTSNPDADVADTYVISAENYDATTGELVKGSQPLDATTIGSNKPLGTYQVGLNYSDLTDNISTTKKLAFDKIQVEAGYKVADIAGFEIKKKFDVKLMSIFEGAELVWYTGKNATGTTASLNGTDNIIMGGTGFADGDTGLALTFAGDRKQAINDNSGIFYTGTTPSQISNGYVVDDDPTLDPPTFGNEKTIKFALSATVVNGTTCTAIPVATGIKVETTSGEPIEVNEGGTLKVTFTDAMGVETESTIPFVKINGKLK